MLKSRKILFFFWLFGLAGCSPGPEEAKKALAEKQIPVTDQALLAKTKDAKGGEADAKLLVAAGVDPNARQANGMTALMSAVFNDQPDVARLLIAKGADVNASAKGFTALRLAVEKGNLPMVKILLENGANPALKPDGAPSALEKAQQGTNPDLVALLRSKAPK